jgi:hypothetical protein
VNEPQDTSLPFFAYGIFKHRQLGHFRIKDLVAKIIPGTVIGSLMERDGLPLLVLDDRTKILGELIYFRSDVAHEAYRRIAEIEPDKIYKWDEVNFNDELKCNALIGKSKSRGSLHVDDIEWDGSKDPYFTVALEEVESILKSNDKIDFEDYEPLFRLQMGYALLWTSIERYAGLRYHLGKKVAEKINHIAEEKAFSDSLIKYVKEERSVFSTVNPEEKCTLKRDNPKKALEYYYQIRCNSLHRGKAALSDFRTVRKSCEELLAIYKDLLGDAFFGK